jgi:hypothetical protein
MMMKASCGTTSDYLERGYYLRLLFDSVTCLDKCSVVPGYLVNLYLEERAAIIDAS